MIISPETYLRHSPNPGAQTETELEAVLDLAEQTVNVHTGGKLRQFERLPAETRELIRRAILCQADCLFANGGTDFLNGTVPESATIGSFSYSVGGDQSGGSELKLCGAARTYLLSAGLLYRGDVYVC